MEETFAIYTAGLLFIVYKEPVQINKIRISLPVGEGKRARCQRFPKGKHKPPLSR